VACLTAKARLLSTPRRFSAWPRAFGKIGPFGSGSSCFDHRVSSATVCFHRGTTDWGSIGPTGWKLRAASADYSSKRRGDRARSSMPRHADHGTGSRVRRRHEQRLCRPPARRRDSQQHFHYVSTYGAWPSRQSDPSVSKAPTDSLPPRVASIATGWSDPGCRARFSLAKEQHLYTTHAVRVPSALLITLSVSE
jgi:hypothetical protein